MDKLPLGKLSLGQIMKGFWVLNDLQNWIEKGQNRAKTVELSNKFYAIIPHNFGRKAPPVIDSKEKLRRSTAMLVSLANIAQAMEMKMQQELLAENNVP